MNAIKTVSALSLATLAVSANAAAIDISGALGADFNTLLGSDSANLVGDATTFWPGGNYAQDVALNGFIMTLDSGDGNEQHYGGIFSGPGTVRINGRFEVDSAFGDLFIGGASHNTMTGIDFNQGTLNLEADAGIDALAGSISYTGANPGEISWMQSNQINDASTIDSTSGVGVFSLELNDNTETLAGLTLKAGDIVETGASGVLTVSSLTVDGSSFGAGTYTSSSAFVTGGGSVIVVPEPGSLALLGLGGLMIARRRRG